MGVEIAKRLDILERKHRRPCDARQWKPKKDPVVEVVAIARKAVKERDELRATLAYWADILEKNWDNYSDSRDPSVPPLDDTAARYTIKTIRKILGDSHAD